MNIDFDKTWPSVLGGVAGLILAWFGGMLRKGIGSETRAPVWKRLDEFRREIQELRERMAVIEASDQTTKSTLKSFGDKLDSIPEHVDRKLEAMEQRIIAAFGKGK